MVEWHIWDFPDNIRVYFTDKFREELYTKLIEICKTRIEIARRLETNKETIRRCFYLGYRKETKIEAYTPVKLIKNIVKTFKSQISKKFLEELERSIIAYRSWNGWEVKSPKLPIKEGPEFYSVVFHVLSDGNASKRHSPYYSNTSPQLIEKFIDELQIFGKVEVRKKIRKDGLIYVRFPKAITDIISRILEISFVRPKHLPQAIFKSSTECKLAAVRAFIDDEGSISKCLSIKQKSLKFLREFKILLNLLGIKSGKIGRDSNGVHTLHIWKESWQKIREDVGLNHPEKFSRLKKLLN